MANSLSQSGHATVPVSTLESRSEGREVHTTSLQCEQLGPLLVHLPLYRIVICKPCKFAVQPKALSSHLLRHHVYREKRWEILEKATELRLLEPNDVIHPSSKVPPFPHLPVSTGYRCILPGCDHLCISQKRMSQHLREHHEIGPRTYVDDHMQPVYLQTFFTGNKVRYFQVEPDVSLEMDKSTERPLKYQFVQLSQPRADENSLRRSPVDNDLGILEDVSITRHQMGDLLYLHQYTTCTGLSLKRGTESTGFWIHDVPLRAPTQPILMHGILGVAAFHQALLASESKERGLHHAAGLRHQSAGLGIFRSIIDHPTRETSTALTAFSRLLGVQFCAEALLEADTPVPWSNTSEGDSRVSKILDFQLLLRGGCDLLLSMQNLLPPGSGLVLSDEALQGFSDLEMPSEVLLGSTPYLVNEVCTRLGSSRQHSNSSGQLFRASSLSDVRGLVDLCLHASKLTDPRQITVGWIEDGLPSRSHLLDNVHLLAEAVADSLGPAEILYNSSHVEGQPSPCPILLCYPYIPPAKYAQLASLPSRLIARVPKPDSLDLQAFDQAMASLVSSYSRGHAADAAWARWDGIESWPRMLPDHFLSMIRAANPLSLVLVAHWCMLLSRQERSYWFLRGQSRRMLLIVLANLDEELQELVGSCISSLDPNYNILGKARISVSTRTQGCFAQRLESH